MDARTPANHYRNDDSRSAIAARQNFRCIWCLRADLRFEATRGEADEAQVDHVTPQSAGGCNGQTNLLLSCGGCNMSRQKIEWRGWAGIIAERTSQDAETIEARVRSTRRRKINRALGKHVRAAYAIGGHAAARETMTRLGYGRWIQED